MSNPPSYRGQMSYSGQGYPGPDPYEQGPVAYRLPPGVGNPATGGGDGMQAQNRRNVTTIGGGDESWYNVGWGCLKASRYGERQLPGRTYSAYIPPRGFSDWLR